MVALESERSQLIGSVEMPAVMVNDVAVLPPHLVQIAQRVASNGAHGAHHRLPQRAGGSDGRSEVVSGRLGHDVRIWFSSTSRRTRADTWSSESWATALPMSVA